MQAVLNHVLKQITPTEKEQKAIKHIIEKVTATADKILAPLGLSQIIAGSFVRNTFMRDKKEFDLFILFPEHTSREDLEKIGLEIGKTLVKKLKGKFKIAYAEHPYVRAHIEGYDVDIVPCYDLKSAEKIKCAVDRTPFHNKWLNKNLPPELVCDVRLFKQFCKANGLYGSDTKTQGFSGYLCELLVIYYKSFKNLIREISEWEAGKVFIDLEQHHIGQQLDDKLKT